MVVEENNGTNNDNSGAAPESSVVRNVFPPGHDYAMQAPDVSSQYKHVIGTFLEILLVIGLRLYSVLSEWIFYEILLVAGSGRTKYFPHRTWLRAGRKSPRLSLL